MTSPIDSQDIKKVISPRNNIHTIADYSPTGTQPSPKNPNMRGRVVTLANLPRPEDPLEEAQKVAIEAFGELNKCVDLFYDLDKKMQPHLVALNDLQTQMSKLNKKNKDDLRKIQCFLITLLVATIAIGCLAVYSRKYL